MYLFSSDLIKTDVTSVKIFGSYIFAGIGNYLHVYTNGNRELVSKILFSNEQIYNIVKCPYTDRLLLHGAKTMKLFGVKLERAIGVTELHSQECEDWILSAKFVDRGSMIVTVSMHNIITLWCSELAELRRCECEERCILYSAHIANENWADIIILSGTVFNQVLIWEPDKTANGFSSVTHRLNGHKGVIFSIDYNLKNGLICSTSDDRTAILWSVQNRSLKSITSVAVLCGHSARVFNCKVLDEFILTSGEDGLVNIWNTKGGLVRRIEAQQGGCVWSLDGDERNNIVVSGGADGGVSVFAFNTFIQTGQIKLSGPQIPKKVIILSSNNLAIITEGGSLFYYNTKDNALQETHTHDDLKSYSLLEKSPCGRFLAAAGFHGNIHFYEEALGCGLNYKLSCQIGSKGRIFSLHWLTCKLFLTCGPAGVLTLWIFGNHVVPIQFFWLPFSKERWSTSACLCGSTCILVGDRRGNLYLYSVDTCEPIQLIKRAHNYLGVTNVYCEGNNVISLGRNSSLNEYSFDSDQRRLTLKSSNKVPFTWLAAIHTTETMRLLLGFSGNNLMIWDYNARRTLLEENCGGGHRSWDHNINADNFYFSFIKDKAINLLSCESSSLHSLDIIKGFHVNTINSLKLLKPDKACSNYIIISGSEDTILRISSTNFSTHESTTVLKSHLSSIRAICFYKVSKVKFLVFSAGGRAQIIMWELNAKLLNDRVSDVSCSEAHSFYEPLNSEESETRIMDLCVSKLIDGGLTLFAACSDGSVKLYSVNHQLSYLRSLKYNKLRCILKISCFRFGECDVLITMATDGDVVIWNVGESRNTHIKAHQSGINTHSVLQISEYRCLILTGGDDNAIALNLLHFYNNSSELGVKKLSSFSDASVHCAQITGSFITEKYFITASVDQRLCLFTWEILQDDEITVELLNTYITTICDIQGMECVDYEGGLKAIVYGNGFEILSLSSN